MDPRVGLDAVVNPCLCQESNPVRPAHSLVTKQGKRLSSNRMVARGLELMVVCLLYKRLGFVCRGASSQTGGRVSHVVCQSLSYVCLYTLLLLLLLLLLLYSFLIFYIICIGMGIGIVVPVL
jgi:hypothetical protein